MIKFLLIFLANINLLQADEALPVKIPPGFALATITENLSSPTAIEFSPDGRAFVTEKSGRLRVVEDGVLLDQPFLTVDADNQGEHGLLGVAFDPNFFVNSYVYVYYVAKVPFIHSRVSRFTANGNIAVVGSEKIILEMDDRGSAIYHVSGAIHFGPDEKLYISSGDNAGYPFVDNSQRLTSTLGKILRINQDGSIPTDNPFYDETQGINRAIWAYGLRNPFTFAFQSDTGSMIINDVKKQIHKGIRGGNYGWPIKIDFSTDPRFQNPIYTYDQKQNWEAGCAVTGGTYYHPMISQYPTQYAGKYFFTDYCRNWIHLLDPATGVVSPFAENVTSSLVSLSVGPDGSLYFLSEWFNGLYKLTFTGSEAPQLITQPQDQIIPLGGAVTFEVTSVGAQPLSYQWQKYPVGQNNAVIIPGAISSSLSLSSVGLSENGTQYRCMVTNSFGSQPSSVAKLQVVNGSAPQVSLELPLDGMRYNAGDLIQFKASALDSKDGVLPDSAYTWEIHFQHDQHFHPFLASTVGIREGSFVVPAQGEPSPNTWYRIYLKVKNSLGLVTTVIRDVSPHLSDFDLTTVPPGLKVTLDGQPIRTPVKSSGVVGFVRSLGSLSPQTFQGKTFEFTSWLDGASSSRTFVTQKSSQTFTAVYHETGLPHRGTLTADPNPIPVCQGTLGASTTLKWTTQGTQLSEIHINSPSGVLLVSTQAGTHLDSDAGQSGTFVTPPWVGEGSTFYLQDVSFGAPLSSDNTLATVQVAFTTQACHR